MNGERTSGLVNRIKDLCTNFMFRNDNRFILEVDKDKIVNLGEKLNELGFDHVKGVTCVDYPDKNTIELVYYIGSYSIDDYASLIVELRTRLSREDPKTPSLIKIWKSCEYHERESYEMFGVIFEGHPKLRRMLLPDDFEVEYPLRKEFKIPEEGIEI